MDTGITFMEMDTLSLYIYHGRLYSTSLLDNYLSENCVQHVNENIELLEVARLMGHLLEIWKNRKQFLKMLLFKFEMKSSHSRRWSGLAILLHYSHPPLRSPAFAAPLPSRKRWPRCRARSSSRIPAPGIRRSCALSRGKRGEFFASIGRGQQTRDNFMIVPLHWCFIRWQGKAFIDSKVETLTTCSTSGWNIPFISLQRKLRTYFQ